MKNKVKGRMFLSCDNMAKEHLERIRLGRQGNRNENNTKREKEDNTGKNHIPMCENTWQHASKCGTIDKVQKEHTGKMCQVQQHKVEKNQVALLEILQLTFCLC